MIANYGGMNIDAAGNREFPGSGGMVGGLSAPGKNYAYLLGAGSEYHSFTPQSSNAILPYDIPPDIPPPSDFPNQAPEPQQVPVPVPTIPWTPTPTTPTTTTPGDQTPPTTTTPTTTQPSTTVMDIIKQLIQGGGSGSGKQEPVYLFTPAQPVQSSGGISMMNIIVLAGLAVAAWFAYTKWVK